MRRPRRCGASVGSSMIRYLHHSSKKFTSNYERIERISQSRRSLIHTRRRQETLNKVLFVTIQARLQIYLLGSWSSNFATGCSGNVCGAHSIITLLAPTEKDFPLPLPDTLEESVSIRIHLCLFVSIHITFDASSIRTKTRRNQLDLKRFLFCSTMQKSYNCAS